MKFRILSLLAAMFVGGCFVTVKPAAEPINIGEEIENMATNAQLWMQSIDAQIEQKAKQIGNLKDQPQWQEIKNHWQILKRNLGAVIDSAASKFNIVEMVRAHQMKAAEGRKAMNELFMNMKKDMPEEQELQLLSDFIESFSAEGEKEPQPLPQREKRPEVVQPKPIQAGRPAIAGDRQKLEADLKKLEEDVKKFEIVLAVQTDNVNARSAYMFRFVSPYFKKVKKLADDNLAIKKFTVDLRNALKANDQQKIAELAAQINGHLIQMVTITQALNRAYDEISQFFPR